MSEPKRYIFRIRECGCVKPEHLEGKYAPSALIIEETEEKCGWVGYEDYARLKAEVERLNAVIESHKDAGLRILAMLDEERRLTKHLKAEVERLTAIVGANAIDREHGMCCDASAQVERLTEAGDELGEWFMDIHPSKKKWNAAKEGKQP